MHKIVIDTNQFISSVIAKQGLPNKLIEAWKNREYILLTSPAIINEISRVFRYQRIKVKYKITEKEINDLITLIEAEAVVLPDRRKVNIIKDDPDDNIFIACTLEGNADYIISGGPHLLNPGEYEKIRIITVREFFEYLILNNYSIQY